MKQLLSIVGALGICLLMPSCQNDQLDEPQLELGEATTLALAPEEGEQVIPIVTNQKQWTAIADADWLEAVPAGKNLLLRIGANTTMTARRAQVVVTAAGLTRSLSVEQRGQEGLSVDLGLDASSYIDVGKEGGDIRLITKSNADTWSASSDVEWLKVLARPRMGELALRVEANTTTESRIGNITFSAGGQSKQLQVKQRGQLHYYLPSTDWGGDFASIERIEKARGSKLQASPDGNARPAVPDYTFATLSAVFPQVKYEFVGYGDKMLYAATLVGANVSEVYSDAFYQFLLEEGYRRVSPESKQEGILEYAHDAKKNRLYISTEGSGNAQVAVVYLYPMREQSSAQPTMASFEHGPISFGVSTRADIETWETNHGGHYDQEFTDVVGVPFWFAPDPFLGRGYIFAEAKPTDPEGYQPPMLRSLQLYSTYRLAFYKYGALDYPTREWEELMAREGYAFWFFEPSGRTYRYIHREKGIAFAVKSFPFAVHDFLLLNLYPLPTAPAAPAPSMVAAEEQVLRALSKTHNRWMINK